MKGKRIAADGTIYIGEYGEQTGRIVIEKRIFPNAAVEDGEHDKDADTILRGKRILPTGEIQVKDKRILPDDTITTVNLGDCNKHVETEQITLHGDHDQATNLKKRSLDPDNQDDTKNLSHKHLKSVHAMPGRSLPVCEHNLIAIDTLNQFENLIVKKEFADDETTIMRSLACMNNQPIMLD